MTKSTFNFTIFFVSLICSYLYLLFDSKRFSYFLALITRATVCFPFFKGSTQPLATIFYSILKI